MVLVKREYFCFWEVRKAKNWRKRIFHLPLVIFLLCKICRKRMGWLLGCQGRMAKTRGGYHRPGQLPHSMSERKVRAKQKESMRNAIMEDMKLAKISLCPDNEIFKKYNSYRGRTMTGPAPIRWLIRIMNIKIYNKDQTHTVMLSFVWLMTAIWPFAWRAFPLILHMYTFQFTRDMENSSTWKMFPLGSGHRR